MRPGLRDEFLNLWRLALPLALAQAGQALMGLVDTAVVGRFSPTAQAAAGLGNTISFSLSYFGIGVMLSFDPLVSQAVGAGDLSKARSHWWQGVWLALIVSIPLVAISVLISIFLDQLGIAPELVDDTRKYMLWRLPAIPGLLLFVVTRSYLQGFGRASIALSAMVIANIANYALDVLLVLGVGSQAPMGATGAAIATSLCTWIQFGLLLPGIERSLGRSLRRPHKESLIAAFRLGAPIGLQFIAESGIFALVGVFAARLSATASAAHQIALNWASLTFCVALGIGSAASTRVGWAVGAKQLASARNAATVALISVVAFMSAMALFFLGFPSALTSVMTTDASVADLAVRLFVVVAAFQIADGVQAVGAGILRGAKDTHAAFAINVVGHWVVGLPVALYLGFSMGLGVMGLWWGLCAGLTAVGAILTIRFYRLMASASKIS